MCYSATHMATRTTKSAKPTTSKRKAVSLQICIDELQLILDLSDESPQDPRLPRLVADAREDILEALAGIHKGDDLPPVKNPLPPED